jgi:hypothetical protein
VMEGAGGANACGWVEGELLLPNSPAPAPSSRPDPCRRGCAGSAGSAARCRAWRRTCLLRPCRQGCRRREGERACVSGGSASYCKRTHARHEKTHT